MSPPLGLVEELALELAAVDEYERRGDALWRARRYAAARIEFAEAALSRDHVAVLQRALELIHEGG